MITSVSDDDPLPEHPAKEHDLVEDSKIVAPDTFAWAGNLRFAFPQFVTWPSALARLLALGLSIVVEYNPIPTLYIFNLH